MGHFDPGPDACLAPAGVVGPNWICGMCPFDTCANPSGVQAPTPLRRSAAPGRLQARPPPHGSECAVTTPGSAQNPCSGTRPRVQQGVQYQGAGRIALRNGGIPQFALKKTAWLARLSARVGNADLRIRNTSSQIRSATSPDAAPVHAVLPDQDGRTDDTCGRAAVKVRRQKLDAHELEVCRQIKIFDVWR